MTPGATTVLYGIESPVSRGFVERIPRRKKFVIDFGCLCELKSKNVFLVPDCIDTLQDGGRGNVSFMHCCFGIDGLPEKSVVDLMAAHYVGELDWIASQIEIFDTTEAIRAFCLVNDSFAP